MVAGGGGLGTEYVFTDALYQISNPISHFPTPTTRTNPLCSQFSCAFIISEKKSCGVVWDEETMGTMDDKTMMASLKRTPDD